MCDGLGTEHSKLLGAVTSFAQAVLGKGNSNYCIQEHSKYVLPQTSKEEGSQS